MYILLFEYSHTPGRNSHMYVHTLNAVVCTVDFIIVQNIRKKMYTKLFKQYKLTIKYIILETSHSEITQ